MATSTLNPVRHGNAVAHLYRAGVLLWVVALALMLAVHFVHLRADFPNHSQWNDWAKYTDEGWYANAAIRHQLTGSWYMQGDFNPAVVLPVWPVMAGLLFTITGVSLTALRSMTLVVFLLDLGLMYALLRRSERRVMALLSVTLAATSAFLSAFTRIAILEPLLIFWFLLALWLAGKIAAAGRGSDRAVFSIELGAVLWLLILTKTTGLCLLPAILWMLWPQHGAQHGTQHGAQNETQSGAQHRRRRFLLSGAMAAGVALGLWALYYMLAVRPHYAPDYHYFFIANTWPRPASLGGWGWNVWYTLHGVLWAGRLLPAVAAATVLLALRPLRGLWRKPLFGAAVLSIAGVLAFVWAHNNTQPRYYTVLLPGVVMVATLGCSALLRQPRWRPAGLAAAALLAAACLHGAWRIAQTAAHPEYTYLRAAQSLASYIDQHPITQQAGANRMVLSVSSDQLRLMTGLPAICDDFGTEPLADRIARYQPAWFASWNDVDGGTLEDIHTRYRLVRAASFAALDDDDRDQLILYRMMPLPGPDVGVDVDNTP